MASNDPADPSGDPQPGDLIEIFRPAYQHWALYLGDGYIINLTPVGQCQSLTTYTVTVFSFFFLSIFHLSNINLSYRISNKYQEYIKLSYRTKLYRHEKGYPSTVLQLIMTG